MVGPLYRILYILSSPINYKLFVLNLESLSFRRINGFFLNLSSVLEAGGEGYSTVLFGKAPQLLKVQPLILLYGHFWQRYRAGTPLVYIWQEFVGEWLERNKLLKLKSVLKVHCFKILNECAWWSMRSNGFYFWKRRTEIFLQPSFLIIRKFTWKRIQGFWYKDKQKFSPVFSWSVLSRRRVLNSLIREGSPASKVPTPYPFIWPFLTEV